MNTMKSQSMLSYSDTQNLQGKLLIATQKLSGSNFEKAVIYLCSHSTEGAMGIVVNHTFNADNTSSILQSLKLPADLDKQITLHLGGPVDMFRGFILHSDDYSSKNTNPLGSGFSLSSSLDVLRDISKGHGPQESLIALGYAGWGAGQLENEIEQDSWLSVPASHDLIFHTANAAKWREASKQVGFDITRYCTVAGHA